MVYTDLLFYCSLGLLCCGGWMPERVSAIPFSRVANSCYGWPICVRALSSGFSFWFGVRLFGFWFAFLFFAVSAMSLP
uniref:Putative secreted peptide n=1 Tax=Anopheles braziliensis TaxID=58242 RepID=A0A2M3ZQP9_9DIPT